MASAPRNARSGRSVSSGTVDRPVKKKRKRGNEMTRAAVCSAIDTPLEVVDVDLQAPKANEVKVRLGASGVGHSGLSVRNGTLPAPLPAVPGPASAGRNAE